MRLLLALLSIGTVAPAAAGETVAAVAANFAAPAEEIAAAFAAATGDRVILSFGATGALYAQITQAAPFSLFLAADSARPAQAIAEGFGVAGSAFTYAVGRLALHSATLELADGAAVLAAGGFHHLAIADPTTAPYGAAAMQVLQDLGLAEALAGKIVVGENITQALQFITSGNAELGFVALAQVSDAPAIRTWIVPAELHAPIRQDAVLLTAGADDPVAKAFLAFLKEPAALAIIERYGYDNAD